MSVVSSSSSSSASTFPPPPTTTSATNDGKASEEKVEEDVVSELEQRVKDVEDTILRFGEKKRRNKISDKISIIIETTKRVVDVVVRKTREFALGFGGFADTFYRSKKQRQRKRNQAFARSIGEGVVSDCRRRGVEEGG